ncbi:MAG: hypothetical protein V4671_24555 [Armatimonadota bacterium]
MRRPNLSLLALVFLLAFADLRTTAFAESDALGKSSRQIVAMGINRWTDLYCDRNQWSTATQAEAARIFGASLRQVNDERITASSLSVSDRESLRTVRRLATAYSAALLEIAARDGGTMWIPIRAGIEAGVEGRIADLIPLLQGRPRPATAARKRTVQRLVAASQKGIRQAVAIVEKPEYAAQAENVRKARASFEEIRKRHATASSPGGVAVLEWFAARSGYISEENRQ